ncbi:MAG: DUF896 domain-containing protein [Firmicutes bacterium]|nr:DUF896 domain-containing protein [Bacillota bacterium]
MWTRSGPLSFFRQELPLHSRTLTACKDRKVRINDVEQLLKRINELAGKAKTNGLSAEEKEEQARLRQEYLAIFRQNFTNVLDNTVIMQPDGSKTPVKRRTPAEGKPDKGLKH